MTLLSRLHFLPAVGSVCVLVEQLYARILAAIWRVDPAILFDRSYYLRMNPDVVRTGVDPLFHFLRYGGREGRAPHPLFDAGYYLERYSDVARSGYNPLLHFLRFGGREGRSPHPDFDAAFYLAVNADVAAAGSNPLAHFVTHGAAERRSPHPDFDEAFYLATNLDLAAAEVNPLLHFVEHGAAEGRLLRRETKGNPPAECFSPSTHFFPAAPPGVVDVIIPVYRGVAETEACLTSVLSSKCAVPFRIVVINDCSPEPEMAGLLRRLADEGRIELVENARNLGFVESVNTGMRASDHDVVLLNSDTLVFGDWVDRLRACAYAEERTGTVTPFSNNATICSYPVFCADNEVSPSTDLASLDAAFASVNSGRSVDIPTAVGFCMYIRRSCLNETGLFDTAAFGLGYGEENDFCMRSAERGWRHKLACNVFVRHTGSVSFGAASARQEAAMRVLVERHPSYPTLVRRHVQADPARAFRIAVTSERIRRSGKRVFLSVLHSLGGGAAEHAHRLAEMVGETAIWLTLRPGPLHTHILDCEEREHRFTLTLDAEREIDTLAAVIRNCGVERIHIHHLMGYSAGLERLVQNLGIPFDHTVHDYYAICPQVTLSDEEGRYCSEPAEEDCDRCIEKRRPAGAVTRISRWREEHGWVLEMADRVIAPSYDTATRMARYFPDARIIAAEHPGADAERIVKPEPLQAREPLRVAVLGTQTIHKGYELLYACAAEAKQGDLPIAFTLIGSVEPAVRRPDAAFVELGRYEEADLPDLLGRVAPHVVWFPTRVPETFSYTLSACLALGLPAAAHDIGAFPERLGARPWSWILSRQSSPSEWTEFLLRIRREHFLTGSPPSTPPPRDRARRDFYPVEYLAPRSEGPKRKSRPRRKDSVRVAATVASDHLGRIQACGHVRLVRPLTHPAVAEAVELTVSTPQELAATDADVFVVQRVAIQDMDTAERLVKAVRRQGARLVYETDDDLFHIPPEHPESAHYVRITKPAKWLARMADIVITSTDHLRQRLLRFNPNTVVLPNLLDDRLWVGAPPRSLDPDNIRILYAGTLSHRADLEFLGCAVRSLRPEFRERIRIDVVGVAGDSTDWFHAQPVPSDVAISYPRFIEWIQARNEWHLGVAPLLDTPFNRAKSPLKFFEYSAMGLPSVCSDISVYRDAVEAGETGILAANSPDVWRDALEMALGDELLWMRMRENCRAAAAAKSISANADHVKGVWTSIARGPLPPTQS